MSSACNTGTMEDRGRISPGPNEACRTSAGESQRTAACRNGRRVAIRTVRALVPLAALLFGAERGLAAPCGEPTAIVVDHRAVTDMALDRVPHRWLQAAKSLAIHHYGASHAHNLLQGALMLDAETQNEAEVERRLHFACTVIDAQAGGAAR